MLLQIFAKGRAQSRVVQNVEIGIVRRDIIVFPTLIPPAKANHPRPAAGEEIFQRRARPTRGPTLR